MTSVRRWTAAELLNHFGLGVLAAALPPADDDEPTAAEGWQACGAADLTVGRTVPPGDVTGRLCGAADAVTALSGVLANPFTIDGPGLLVQREQLCRITHRPAPGRTLRGGGWMYRTADGWIALNLARPHDRELVPALTNTAVQPDTEGLVDWMAHQATDAVLERCTLLGLAGGRIPSTPLPAAEGPVLLTTGPTDGRRRSKLEACTVIDLSLLWAGPLATALLAAAGAHVIRVIHPGRPPTPEPDDAVFVRILNGDKEVALLDLADTPRLNALLDGADVVVTSMRERAITKLGLRPRPDQVWIALSGHGSTGSAAERVGYGDDCAATAGLVVHHRGAPAFAADAIADPMTGLLAATAALGMLATNRGGRVNLNLVDVARWSMSLPAPEPPS